MVDVSKVDMSTDILGVKYDSPIIIAPSGGHYAYHAEGEPAVARAAKVGDHLQILSTNSTTSIKDVIASRGKPIWYQLYATNKFEVAKHHVESAEQQGAIAVAVTIDSSGGRNQETLRRLARTDTRDCAESHDRSSLSANYKRRPMYQGADLSGLTDISATALTWEKLKRIRPTKMKMVLRASSPGRMPSCCRERLRQDHCRTTAAAPRPGPSSIDALPGSSRRRARCRSDHSGFRRGTDIVKALCMGAKGVAVGRPICGGSARSARRAIGVAQSCALSCAAPCSRSARRPSSTSCRMVRGREVRDIKLRTRNPWLLWRRPSCSPAAPPRK
jgi:isopentenyl diphosphate isomerase/L-lactate dehydrogenase-like FMN-dependent dehydrogenase